MAEQTRLSFFRRSPSHQVRSFLPASAGSRPPTATGPTKVFARTTGACRAATTPSAVPPVAVVSRVPRSILFIRVRTIGPKEWVLIMA